MTEVENRLQVFICHASADKPKVRSLNRYLQECNVKSWFDEEELIPGQKWEEEIPRALDASNAVIVCLSEQSINKEGYVQNEIQMALEKARGMPPERIFLIPARLDQCEVPYSLKKYQWVDLFVESGYIKLIEALNLRANQLHFVGVQVSKKGRNVVSQFLYEEIESKQSYSNSDSYSSPSNTIRNIQSDKLNHVEISVSKSIAKLIAVLASLGILIGFLSLTFRNNPGIILGLLLLSSAFLMFLSSSRLRNQGSN